MNSYLGKDLGTKFKGNRDGLLKLHRKIIQIIALGLTINTPSTKCNSLLLLLPITDENLHRGI